MPRAGYVRSVRAGKPAAAVALWMASPVTETRNKRSVGWPAVDIDACALAQSREIPEAVPDEIAGSVVYADRRHSSGLSEAPAGGERQFRRHRTVAEQRPTPNKIGEPWASTPGPNFSRRTIFDFLDRQCLAVAARTTEKPPGSQCPVPKADGACQGQSRSSLAIGVNTQPCVARPSSRLKAPVCTARIRPQWAAVMTRVPGDESRRRSSSRKSSRCRWHSGRKCRAERVATLMAGEF